jgi:putative flavoprotein involved in K+ transport
METQADGGDSMLDDGLHQKVETVLGKLERAFASNDINAAVNLFQDCYWRGLNVHLEH